MTFTLFNDRFPQRQLPPGAEIIKVDIQSKPYLGLEDAVCALVAWVRVQKAGGSFIVNLDDTDPDPLASPDLASVINALSWLGLSPNEWRDSCGYGPYVWSERWDIYREVAQHLIGTGQAYHCFCASKNHSSTPPFFQAIVTHHQPCDQLNEGDEIARLIAGEKSTICLRVDGKQNQVTGSFPLFTPDGAPMPYFAHVVDNYLMQVTTHVRRHSALELVTYETALCQALGWPMPTYLHLPPIQDPQSSALFEEPCLSALLTENYSSKAMVNYLAHLICPDAENTVVDHVADKFQHFEVAPHLPETLILDYQLLNSIQERYTYE